MTIAKLFGLVAVGATTCMLRAELPVEARSRLGDHLPRWQEPGGLAAAWAARLELRLLHRMSYDYGRPQGRP
jgi:hypothetical protein